MQKPSIAYLKEKVRVIDQRKTAQIALAYRQACGVLITQVAQDEDLDMSIAMISYLEHGKRNWNEEDFGKYINAVTKCANRNK